MMKFDINFGKNHSPSKLIVKQTSNLIRTQLPYLIRTQLQTIRISIQFQLPSLLYANQQTANQTTSSKFNNYEQIKNYETNKSKLFNIETSNKKSPNCLNYRPLKSASPRSKHLEV